MFAFKQSEDAPFLLAFCATPPSAVPAAPSLSFDGSA